MVVKDICILPLTSRHMLPQESGIGVAIKGNLSSTSAAVNIV